MLRKQTKKILFVMLFALTLVLAGRVDANAQTAAPAGVKQVKAGSSSVTVQWNAVMQNDEEGHLEVVKEEGRQLGLAEGKIKERSNGIKVFIKLCKEVNLSDEDTIYKLMKNYKLSKEEAVNAIKNNS